MYRNRLMFLVAALVIPVFPVLNYAQRPPADEIVGRTNPLKTSVLAENKNARLSKTAPLTEREAIRLKDPSLLNDIGVDLAGKGRFDDAARVLKEAIKLAPNMAAMHINLSTIHEHLGRLDDSLRLAQRATKLAPQRPRAYMQLCGVYYQLSRFDEATRCYEVLVKLAPDDPQAKSEMGAALVRAGHTDRALKVLREVIASTPLFARAHNSIGFALFKKKKYKDAAAAFKRAVEIEPSSTLYRYNLGVSYALNNNKPGALLQYRSLKSVAPERAQQIYRLVYRDKLVFVEPPESP